MKEFNATPLLVNQSNTLMLPSGNYQGCCLFINSFESDGCAMTDITEDYPFIDGTNEREIKIETFISHRKHKIKKPTLQEFNSLTKLQGWSDPNDVLGCSWGCTPMLSQQVGFQYQDSQSQQDRSQSQQHHGSQSQQHHGGRSQQQDESLLQQGGSQSQQQEGNQSRQDGSQLHQEQRQESQSQQQEDTQSQQDGSPLQQQQEVNQSQQDRSQSQQQQQQESHSTSSPSVIKTSGRNNTNVEHGSSGSKYTKNYIPDEIVDSTAGSSDENVHFKLTDGWNINTDRAIKKVNICKQNKQDVTNIFKRRNKRKKILNNDTENELSDGSCIQDNQSSKNPNIFNVDNLAEQTKSMKRRAKRKLEKHMSTLSNPNPTIMTDTNFDNCTKKVKNIDTNKTTIHNRDSITIEPAGEIDSDLERFIRSGLNIDPSSVDKNVLVWKSKPGEVLPSANALSTITNKKVYCDDQDDLMSQVYDPPSNKDELQNKETQSDEVVESSCSEQEELSQFHCLVLPEEKETVKDCQCIKTSDENHNSDSATSEIFLIAVDEAPLTNKQSESDNDSLNGDEETRGEVSTPILEENVTPGNLTLSNCTTETIGKRVDWLCESGMTEKSSGHVKEHENVENDSDEASSDDGYDYVGCEHNSEMQCWPCYVRSTAFTPLPKLLVEMAQSQGKCVCKD